MATTSARWTMGILVAGTLLAGAAGTLLRAGGTGRAAVPAQGARDRAAALVAEVFKQDLESADDADALTRLANTLLQQAKDVKDDAALRYVLLANARDLAAKAGDVTLAFVAADELGKSFDVNPLSQKADALTLAVGATASADAARTLADTALPLITEALEADNYDAARALGRVVSEAARKAKNAALVEEAGRRNEEIQSVEKGFARLQTFVNRLKRDPTDADANAELGKYYGFLKRNWNKALPLLAKGSDKALADLARRDLAAPADAHVRLALADAWWDRAAAEKEPARVALQARAAYWYDRAVGQLAGLYRTKAQKRAEVVFDKLRGNVSAVPAGPIGELKKFEGHTDEIKGVAFSPDGRLGVSGGRDESVRVWDLVAGKEGRLLRGHTKQVWDVAFHPNGRQVFSASWDRTVRLWDVKTGNEVKRYEHRIDVNGVAPSRDGGTFLSASDDHNAYLWNTATGEEVRRYPGHTNFVYAVAFAPDGRHVATGGVDKTVRVFELNTAQQTRLFEGHNNSVTRVAFSPDSRYVFSAGDNAVHQWEIASGKEVRRFEGHSGLVPAMALSPDGRRLVTGGDDRTIRVWDVATGKELQKLQGHTDTVSCVAISHDGHRLLSGSLDRTVRLWGLPVR
jgi:hypothetical protein